MELMQLVEIQISMPQSIITIHMVLFKYWTVKSQEPSTFSESEPLYQVMAKIHFFNDRLPGVKDGEYRPVHSCSFSWKVVPLSPDSSFPFLASRTLLNTQ